MKTKYFLTSPQQKHVKYSVFFSTFIFLSVIFSLVLHFGYESCIVLYIQTAKIYSLKQKKSIVLHQEKEIIDLKKNIQTKFQQKRKLEHIINHAHRVFDYYDAISRALSDSSALMHCSIDRSKILFTARSNESEITDRILDQLKNNEDLFILVQLQSLEKTADNSWVFTVIMTPKIVFYLDKR